MVLSVCIDIRPYISICPICPKLHLVSVSLNAIIGVLVQRWTQLLRILPVFQARAMTKKSDYTGESTTGPGVPQTQTYREKNMRAVRERQGQVHCPERRRMSQCFTAHVHTSSRQSDQRNCRGEATPTTAAQCQPVGSGLPHTSAAFHLGSFACECLSMIAEHVQTPKPCSGSPP